MPGGQRGGGSLARWLADRAGSSGSVFAMDVDRRFLELPPAITTVVGDIGDVGDV